MTLSEKKKKTYSADLGDRAFLLVLRYCFCAELRTRDPLAYYFASGDLMQVKDKAGPPHLTPLFPLIYKWLRKYLGRTDSWTLQRFLNPCLVAWRVGGRPNKQQDR